jgi:hypothetical protein
MAAGLFADARAVRAFRLCAQHLDIRLPSGSEREAAWAGLQDTAPRSALLELHARMAGVGPSGWESPDLAQIWLRGAAYVVPRSDIGVFTIGAMPRDPEATRDLETVAERLVSALDGRPRRYGEIEAAGFSLRQVRMAGPTGRVAIRWDASATWVVPIERPAVDPEEARLELARRFLAWHGPAAPGSYARWAGVARVDAVATFHALDPELIPVHLDDQPRRLRRADAERFAAAEPLGGIRLLAMDDPYLYLDGPTLIGDRPRLDHLDPAALGHRLVNSLAGRVLVDGRLVGSWGRVEGRYTLAPWRALPARDRDRVAAEVESAAGPLGRPVDVRWLEAPPGSR